MVLGLIRINIYSCSYSWLHFQLDYQVLWCKLDSKYRFWLSTIPIPTPLLKLVDKRTFPRILQWLTKQISTFGWSCGHKNEHNLTTSEISYLKYSVSLNNILWSVSCSWRLILNPPSRIQVKKNKFLALWKWVQVNWEKRVLRHWIRTIILVPSQNSRLSW